MSHRMELGRVTARARDVPAALSTLHERLGELAVQATRFDARSFEARERDVRATAIERCTELATQTRELFEAVLRACSTVQSASEAEAVPSGDVQPGAVVEQPSRGEMLETVTVLARMDIERVLERALGAAQPGADNLVFVGSSLLRKTCRGLSAVDRELAALLLSEPRFPVQSSAASALRVRKAYAWFRRGVDFHNEPNPTEIVKVIRGLGTRIATLVGKAEYAELRPDDRILFARLQQRVLQWLGQPTPTYEEGRRLWDDYRAMVDMLRQVNLRAELIAHDAKLASELLSELVTLNDAQRPGARFFERLAALEGLDEELDRQLAERSTASIEVIVRVLERAVATARGRGV